MLGPWYLPKKKLIVDANDLKAKQQQTAFNNRLGGGGMMTAGMMTSMIAGGDTLIGKLGTAAMMLGTIQMMMPKVFGA